MRSVVASYVFPQSWALLPASINSTLMRDTFPWRRSVPVTTARTFSSELTRFRFGGACRYRATLVHDMILTSLSCDKRLMTDCATPSAT